MINEIKTNEVYATFCSPIDQNAVGRIFNGVSLAVQNLKASHIHLLFQSTGGFVGDGICLYNYFKTLPVDLTIYNVGSVQSIATIAFIGASKRKTSASATFVLHRSSIGGQPATATRLKSMADTAALEDARTEIIIRENITLSSVQWDTLNHHDLHLSAEESVKCGIAEIGEFSPPKGTIIYNI